MPAEVLGIAIVGCGRIAASHVDAIQAMPDRARLLALVDPDAAARADLAARSGAPHSFADIDAALAREDVDAVVVCSPNALHAAQAIRALEAGKHVLVEKPMAETPADARAMAAAADRAGRVLAIAHPFRHSAALDHFHAHRGDFGELMSLEITQCVFWDGPQAPWWATRAREGGLVLSLLGPHAFDFVSLVMPGDAVRVHVEAARWQGGWRAEDEAMVLIAYPGGRLASVHLSYNQRHVTDRKTLFFDRGVLILEDGERLRWNGETLVEPAPGVLRDPHAMSGRDLSGFFRAQMREFVAAGHGEASHSVLADEGVRQIDLLQRILAAAQEGFADATS